MKYLFGIFIFLFLLISGCKLFGTFGEYSNGVREGKLSKFSKKGLIWETYEGELLLGGLKSTSEGVAANIFYFSVNDQTIADSLSLKVGQNVKLDYTEFINVSIREGNTNYLINNILK